MSFDILNTLTEELSSKIVPLGLSYQILYLLIVPTIYTILINYIYRRVTRVFSADTSVIFKSLVRAIYLPLSIYIWPYVLLLLLKSKLPDEIILKKDFFHNLPIILIVALLGHFLIRFSKFLMQGFLDNKDIVTQSNRITIQLFTRLISIITFISVILSALHLSGLNLTVILLYSGSYFITIVAYIVLNTFLRIAYHKLMKAVAQKSRFLLFTIVKSIYIPLQVLLFVQALFVSYKILTFKWTAPAAVENSIMKLQAIIMVSLLAWFLISFIRIFEEQLLLGRLTKKTPSKTTVQASGKLLRVGMVVVLILISLPIIGIPISGILAFSGGSAIVVGIAVRPILANYFGGLLIYSDRFFEVGDWIHSPDQDIEGTVENIGWRSTRIRTFDKRPLYVPNSTFSSISVVNATRMLNRRIKQTFGIRYEDSGTLAQITDEIRNMLIEHPEIDTNQSLMVHFLEFGPSTLNINVYTFTKTKDWKKYRDVQQDIFLKIISIIEGCGAKLAMPGQRIDIENSIPHKGL